MELVAVLVILAAVVIIQNYLYQKYGLSNVIYTCSFDKDEVYEGDEIIFTEEISNCKLLPLCWLKSELTTSRWLEFPELQSNLSGEMRYVSSFFMLKSYHKVVRRWTVRCSKRGVFGIDKAVLVATDILGNVNVSRVCEVSAGVTVLPTPAELPPQICGRCSLSGDNVVRSGTIKDPFYVNGVHEYDESNPYGRISWRATARTGEIMVFNNEYTYDGSVTVILNVQSRGTDRFTPTQPRQVEYLIKLAAAVVERCGNMNLPVRIISNGMDTDGSFLSTPCGTGIANSGALLHALARLRLEFDDDFGTFLYKNASSIPNTDIIMLTPYTDARIAEYASMTENVTVISSGNPDDTLSSFAVYYLHGDSGAKEEPA